MFIVVPFSSSTGLAIVAEASLRCGDFFPKKVVTVLAVFLSFWSWLPDIPCFHKFEKQSCFFGVDNAFFTGWCYLGVLNNCFQFFLSNHVFLCVYQWCGFSRYKFFHFWSLFLADIILLICFFVHLFKSTGVAVVALANLRWCFFVSTKLSQIGSFY